MASKTLTRSIFWRQRLPLYLFFFRFFVFVLFCFFCFFSQRWKIKSRPLLWLDIYKLPETNDNLKIYMVNQEIIVFPEAVVIYFSSITCDLKEALSNKATFVSSRNGKERCGTWQKGFITTRSTDYCVVTKGASPQIKGARKALRDKTKNWCTKVLE